MKIHFAFGGLGKAGMPVEQIDQFINNILTKKQLKYSICEEFIPIPKKSDMGNINLDINKGELNNGHFTVFTDDIIESPKIHYLPVDVSMVCFIEIAYKKLALSLHHQEYGKLGIAFTQEFYDRNDLQRVSYYSEKMILKDPLIKKYEEGQGILDPKLLNNISSEITKYKKPKKLYKNFSRSTVAAIKNGLKLEFYTYSRYPENYNFENENEHRFVTEESKEYLGFCEKDVYQIIVPDEEAKRKVSKYIEYNWAYKPKISVFPEKKA